MIKTDLKINICTAFDGWILPQLATNWAENIENCSVSDRPSMESDVNFYVNYHIFHSLGYRKTNHDVGYFTHKEPSKPYDEVANSIDHCIGMSRYAYDLLPANKRSLLSPVGADRNLFPNKDVIIGVVGRNYPGGRKNFNILNKLNEIKGVSIKLTGGGLSKSGLVDFYQSIDYLLVTDLVSGGPVTVLESLLVNKPVIAPNIGWCWEFPVIKYSSFEELESIISKLASPSMSWEDSARELVSILEKSLQKK